MSELKKQKSKTNITSSTTSSKIDRTRPQTPVPLGSTPWMEKYRPTSLDQIVSHTEIVISLKKFISHKTLPHLLFYGPSGSGKTSTIRACANEIYKSYTYCMVLQINASNERGIETVRTKIKNFVDNKNTIFLPVHMQNLFKMVILDEIDSMTVEAQGMLRQTIEKNSDTTRFCLICNDIDKINIALQSRCALLRFSPLSYNDMQSQLNMIVKIEGIICDDNAIDAIIKNSKGDLRSAINKLQEISVIENNEITHDAIYKTSGYMTPEVTKHTIDILLSLFNSKLPLCEVVMEIVQILIDNNVTIFNLLNELKNHVISTNKFDDSQKIFILDHFAQYEIYDSVNVDPFNIVIMICSLFVVITKMT